MEVLCNKILEEEKRLAEEEKKKQVHDNIETLICTHIKKYKSLQNERETIHDTCYNYINDLYNKL